MADQPISGLTDGANVQAGDKLAVDRGGVSYKAAAIGADGWIDDTAETWTYASADGHTFTFTISGDQTGKYAVGQRIKLTQTTVKYFIVTKVSYSSPNTTVTVYGGTDYTLANATISANYHSIAKAPFGFPLDPTKWTEVLTDTSGPSVSTTSGTVVNPGSLSLAIPIGAWDVDFFADAESDVSGTYIVVSAGLSTANNSYSDHELVAYGFLFQSTNNADFRLRQGLTRRKTIVLTAKTSYYLVASWSSSAGGTQSISLQDASATTTIRARCAYL